MNNENLYKWSDDGEYLFFGDLGYVSIEDNALIVAGSGPVSDYDAPPIPIELIEELIAKWRSK